jgi:hypothetical protein
MPDSARPPMADPPAGREMAARAHELARRDDIIFPPLRLTPVPGEPRLDNMLRQIEALMRPLPGAARPALPPPSAGSGEKRSGRPPPAAKPIRRAPRAAAAERAAALRAVTFLALLVTILVPAPDLSPLWPLRGSLEKAAPPVAVALAQSVSLPMPPASPPPAAAVAPAPPAAPEPLIMLAATPAASAPPAERAGAPAASGLAAVLMEHGKRLLGAGDIASARQFLERAAGLGAPGAAGSLGKSYDPLFLRQINAIGVRADAPQAVAWYRKAAGEGDAEAALALERLREPDAQAKAE